MWRLCYKLLVKMRNFCRCVKRTSVDCMPPYITSFEERDHARVFAFLATFARWECALKHGEFVRAGLHGQAEADWKSFANKYAVHICEYRDTDFTNARATLLAKPPRREEYISGTVSWQDNPRRDNETDAGYLLRVIRDVRNNLFHGGKYAGGPEPETARDRDLIDCALLILRRLVELDPTIKARFEESV
jgi:hypothetical protein